MGHHCVVIPSVTIVHHITTVHQQVTRTSVAAVERLAQTYYLVSAKQTSGNHFAIGHIGTVVTTAVRCGL